MKEQQELLLIEVFLQKLQQWWDQEFCRLEEEVCRVVQEFFEFFNFDEIDECVWNIEWFLFVGSEFFSELVESVCEEKFNFNFSQFYLEEEVDEGFEVDDDVFKDFFNFSEYGYLDQ